MYQQKEKTKILLTAQFSRFAKYGQVNWYILS
jgi:hypothetical protein